MRGKRPPTPALPPLHFRVQIPALDGLRGLAILLVFVYHSVLYSGWTPEIRLDLVLHRLSMVGWAGVDLFFVLSGFLITGILLDTKDGPHYFRHFYARRTLRIFPLYYGFLFLSLVVLPGLVPLDGRLLLPAREGVWFWTYLVNVSVAVAGWAPHEPFVHFWSLAVEEQFYLAWPLVVFALKRRTLMLVCLGILVGSLGLRVALVLAGERLAAFVLTPARMDTLALGALLAMAAREAGVMARLARWLWPTVIGSSVLLGMIFAWRRSLGPTMDPVVQTIGFTLVAILCGGILTAAVVSPSGGLAGRFFSHWLLRALGRYSYGLYVFHVPVIRYMAVFFGAESLPEFAGSHLPGQMAFTGATAAVSVGVAVLSWHLFESRILRLKALFAYAAETGRPATEQAAVRASGTLRRRANVKTDGGSVPS